MRSFIIASLILFIMIGLIICNSLWLIPRLDELISLCEDKSGSPDLEKLISRWQDCRRVISLSVNRSELDRAENALCGLSAFEPSSPDFQAKLRELISALHSIRDAQCFSLDNIL